ncbi:hypothetical protein GCM10010967_12860 [Dyadobacter beijingensis]|uniref:RHS repeat-associated protein n=2 Tax=Dyadobacter beijingensis TaxID=365489 RepID=A0ABQ2HI91_9BACT|nr:hypothetical protein GCM10010967_12860 [Dyadobacter beijingensis]
MRANPLPNINQQYPAFMNSEYMKKNRSSQKYKTGLLTILICANFALAYLGAPLAVLGQNVTYQTLHTTATFDGRALSESLPVGSIAGNGDVASGGSAYNIPILVPPGTNGVVPSIAMNYHSMAGNGVLGFGWHITGLSTITRTTRNMYFDNATNPIVMTNDDRFVLDGTRMILKTGNYGEPDATYGLETEDFSTITSKGTQGNGPEWMEVVTKDGIKMEYGNDPYARHVGQFATVLTWAITKITYPDGNYIQFKYKQDAYFALLVEEINYTGNTVTNLAPYNQIRFDYKIRTVDENSGYQDDTRIEMKYLLDKITVKAEGQTARSYQFNYGHNNINSFLKEVVQSGSDGTSLNATIFKYGDQPTELTVIAADGYDNPSSTIITGDFNADGMTDFLEGKAITSPSSAYRIQINTKYQALPGQPNTFSIANITDLPITYSVVKKNQIPNSYGMMAYDFTGDGADDVLLTNVAGSGTNRTLTSLHLYKTVQNYNWSQNGQFEIQFDPLTIPPYTGFPKIHPTGHFIFPGDYDGDGVQDILTMLGTSGNFYASHLYFGNNSTTFGTVGITAPYNFNIADWPTVDKVHVVDFNGDGKSDLMLIKGSNCEIFTFDGWIARRIHFSSTYLNKDHLTYFGDFNSDRKTDVLAKNPNGTWKVLVSNGRYFYESPFVFNTAPDTDPYTGDHLAVADINGDGKSDVYHAWQASGSSTSNFDVYYGRGFSGASWLAGFHRVNSTYSLNLGALQPMIGDFDGDGRTDLINFKNIFTPMDILYFRKEGKEHMLEKVKNGYNHVTEWNYKKLTDGGTYFVRGNLTSYPLNSIQPPLFTVSDFKQQNGIGGVNVIQYAYDGVKFHRAGKGFLGLGKITVSNLATGVRTITQNQFNTTYFTSSPYQVTTSLISGQSLSQTTNTNEFIASAPKRFWIKVSGVSEVRSFEKRNITTTNTYDTFGNVTQSVVNNNNVETTTTTTEYGDYPVVPGGVDNKPTLVTVSTTRSGESAHSVRTRYGYNANGQLTSKTDFDGLAKNVATVYQYHPLGNLWKTTITPGGTLVAGARTTSSTFDAKGRYAESSQNELQQTSGATYDPKWGKPLTTVGIDGLTTTYQYDVFGRPTVTTLPGTPNYNIVQTYAWSQGSGAVWKSATMHPGKPDVTTWYDVLGREIKTESQAYPSGLATQVQTYDARGNIASTTMPYKSAESIITTTTLYDDHNRAYSINSGNLGTTTVAYSYDASGKLTTTTTAPSGISSKTTDASGKVVSSADAGGTLNYTYFSHGGVKDIKFGTTVTASTQYDVYGRQTQLADANAGTTLYEYNALGQLATQTNPKGHTFTMVYDLAGRITQRSRPGEPATVYKYYASGNGINQIEKVTGFAGNVEDYSYDAYGRLTSIKETIDGTQYTLGYGYNNYGDITSTTYPSGFGTNHSYDANGYLMNIKNSSNSITLYTNSNLNGLGQNTAYSLGNGQASTVTYTNGYPTQYSAGTLQNLTLVWDYQKGNLTSRTDARAAVNKTESFIYDNVNRLTTSTIGSGSPFSTVFAANGNISTKTDAGTYSYHASKFNAVVGITNPSPSPVPTLQQDVTYTPFSQPDTIREVGSSGSPFTLTYLYGADYERIKGVLKQNTTVIGTRYYFSGYDVDDLGGGSKRYVQYIGSPAGLIAIVESNGSSHNIHYTYTDHLGSILTTTGSSGTIEAEQSFDAWGRRRNPTSWALMLPTAATSLPAWLFRGYTGHEHLDNFGLVNMNGRLYDPVVARMLSADNYVQAGNFTQAYNRYSYAGNNPLKYSDPNGEFFNLAFFAGAFISDFATNLMNDVDKPFKTAYRNASNAVTSMGNALQVQVYSRGNTSATVGINILSFGIGANIYHTEGNLTTSVGASVGLMSGAMLNWSVSYAAGSLNIGIGGGYGANYDVKTGGWAHSYSALGGRLSYKGYGLGYYQTHYGNALGPDGKPNNQVVGGVNVYLDDVTLRLENDFLAFEDEDRWRSNAVEIGIGNIVIGTRLYNNDPKGEGQGFDKDGKDRMGFSNKQGFGAWNAGKVYSSPLWFGARFGNTVDRIGYSHPMVQDRTQNWVHRNGFFYLPFGHQNFYIDDSEFKMGSFLHTGYYNPYSLWGK